MSKYKLCGQIGQTSLRQQVCRGKEIAPLYVGNQDLPHAKRVQLATAEAWLAGYQAVAVSKPRDSKASIYVFDGTWQPADWGLGKWGPAKGLHFTPVHRLMPSPVTMARPLHLLPARVGI